jgi:hypothetical protein
MALNDEATAMVFDSAGAEMDRVSLDDLRHPEGSPARGSVQR